MDFVYRLARCFQRDGQRILLLLILLLLSGCGGLAGEPRIVATFPPATPAPQEIGYPSAPPDLAIGAQIFAEHCTRCHGPQGHGDGELIGTGEGQIPNAPRDFTDPATTQDQTPLDWYTIITSGRLENGMPPWKKALTESERWAVTLYTYTLHYHPEQIAQGQTLLAEQNLSVDNLQSQSELVRWTDRDLLANVAQNAGENIVTSINTLDENQRQSLAAYLRTQTVTNTQVIGQEVAQQPTPPQPASTEEAAAAVTRTVTGRITNGTAGGTVPPNLTVKLHTFDDQFNDEPRETAASPDNTFAFPDVEIRADRTYLVTLEYQDRVFGSDFIPGDPAATTLDLPVTIYELTSDPAVIQIKGMDIAAIVNNDSVQIAEIIRFVNTSDRLYTTDQNFGENAYGSVTVPVPSGAQLMGFDNQQRYVVADDGSSITDTAPVMPGENHVVHMIYSLPYSGDLRMEQVMNYAIEGPVRLLITPESISVNSDQLPLIGPETLSGEVYQSYGATLSLAAQQPIRYQLRGAAPINTATGSPSVVPVNNLIPIILVSIGSIAIVTAAFLYFKGRTAPNIPIPTDDQRLSDGLIRQIAELDDLYAAGDIDEATYSKRRNRLKARLADLMDKEE